MVCIYMASDQALSKVLMCELSRDKTVTLHINKPSTALVRLTNRQKESQTDRQTDRQTDERQTDKKAGTDGQATVKQTHRKTCQQVAATVPAAYTWSGQCASS